ncbi:hypothetical protein ACIBI9_04100 [Nonomuraea sp. NPDC050451]|uniref:hypothetical protein n=1 Tax=Nonomuraea sp. NPDC050451 TaxID=3364364 RepID=UPI0037AC0930
MTNAQLDALAEHYAKNFVLETTAGTVEDAPEDFEPYDPAALLADFRKLVELADQADDGTPQPMRSVAAKIDDDGRERWALPEHLRPVDLNHVLMYAAAEFHALMREAFAASNQFAALRQLQRVMNASPANAG